MEDNKDAIVKINSPSDVLYESVQTRNIPLLTLDDSGVIKEEVISINSYNEPVPVRIKTENDNYQNTELKNHLMHEENINHVRIKTEPNSSEHISDKECDNAMKETNCLIKNSDNIILKRETVEEIMSITSKEGQNKSVEERGSSFTGSELNNHGDNLNIMRKLNISAVDKQKGDSTSETDETISEPTMKQNKSPNKTEETNTVSENIDSESSAVISHSRKEQNSTVTSHSQENYEDLSQVHSESKQTKTSDNNIGDTEIGLFSYHSQNNISINKADHKAKISEIESIFEKLLEDKTIKTSIKTDYSSDVTRTSANLKYTIKKDTKIIHTKGGKRETKVKMVNSKHSLDSAVKMSMSKGKLAKANNIKNFQFHSKNNLSEIPRNTTFHNDRNDISTFKTKFENRPSGVTKDTNELQIIFETENRVKDTTVARKQTTICKPVDMTLSNEDDCEVVYNIPLLKLPSQDKPVHFSPQYLHEFLTKIRTLFSLKKFLARIPDPVSYFTKEKKRQNCYKDKCLSIIYLKSRYRRLLASDIDTIYRKNAYNLTLTCEELDIWDTKTRTKNRRKINACTCQIPHELTMAFIQEITFIEHRSLIERHLNSKSLMKALALSEAGSSGNLQECVRCRVNHLQEDTSKCANGHTFCHICIQAVMDTRLQENVNPFSCLVSDCNWTFHLHELKKIVKPVTFSCLLHVNHLKQIQLAGIKLLETCPSCGFADILSEDARVFNCLNPECFSQTCRKCKGVFNYNHKCIKRLKYSEEFDTVKQEVIMALDVL